MSPFKRHLVRYKNLFVPENNNTEGLQDVYESMIQIHITPNNTLTTTDIPLERLIISEVITIQQELNNQIINRSRVIVGNNEYGVRSRFSITSTLIIHGFITKIHRLTYKVYVIIQYDTIACYDRINIIITTIVSKIFDEPESLYKL